VTSHAIRIPLNFTDIWRYRELLYFFTWRDIKVRYKQTALGAIWAVLQPFLTMLIFAAILGSFFKLREGVPYAVFVYSALLPWTLFQYALTQATGSLVGNSEMLTKVYFPRILLPIAITLAGMVDFAIASILLVGMLWFYHIPPTWNLVSVPAFFVLAMLASVAAGIWLSAINVKFRDVRYAVPFLLQVWFYATPIVLPPNVVHGLAHWIFILNPISGIVEGFRWSLVSKASMDWTALIISCAFTAATLVGGLYYFRRMEETFADVV